jgi:hypothetical protein
MGKLTDIITNLNDYDIEYRIHAARRMFQRDIYEDEVENIIKNGEIIEQYDDDFPLPSMLINGMTPKMRPLHMVLSVNYSEKKIIIITVYEPDSLKWTDNFSRRVK